MFLKPDFLNKDCIIKALGDDIEYGNFNAEVGRRPDQAPKLHAYHEIWALMAAHKGEVQTK